MACAHGDAPIRPFSVKNYILDTNVLLHDPNSILNFQEHNVLIPIEVIEEVDRFKRESTERGANARTVSRTLDSLRAKGRLSEGVTLPNGGRLRVIFQDKNQNGHLTSGDNNVDSRIVALAKVDATDNKLVPITDAREGAWGIKPRNREQHFAFDALLDDRVKLVTLMGKAGTGKTLLAMAAGLKKTVQDREYRRLVVARPTISMGKELGFLPGSLEEKLNPWMQPIHDALEMLSDLNMGHEQRRGGDLMRSGIIVVEALSYIRGRSIANQFMVIDEAQNLTPLEVKTIITRVGHGTKIVFTGDPYQIDNPYVDSSSNGFNYVVSRFRTEPVAAHIEFQKGERSELAELAANIL